MTLPPPFAPRTQLLVLVAMLFSCGAHHPGVCYGEAASAAATQNETDPHEGIAAVCDSAGNWAPEGER